MIGDPDLLERLAANLVSNAIRHNVVDGRVDVATRTESDETTSPWRTPVHMSLRENSNVYFEPFQRLASRDDGVGLGLAIVQAVADVHDATITARARINGGLKINVAFPALN